VCYNFDAYITGLSSFFLPLLPLKIAKSCEIPIKFDRTAVRSHPMSLILVSIESS